MKCVWNHIIVFILWLVVCIKAESHYYRRNYFNPITAPSSRYYHQARAYLPIGYSGDLETQESKRKESSKGYSKKIPFRPFASIEDDFSKEHFSSGEFSNEGPHGYESKEQDSREYTIGTQIHVQHPITVPKKPTSPHPKYAKYKSSPSPSSYRSSSYSDVSFSAEGPVEPPTKKKHAQKYTTVYEPDPFHVIPPPKSTAPSTSSSPSYNVFDGESEDYALTYPSKIKPSLRNRFKDVASKKQIEKYLEDQEKMLDEALRMQLLKKPKYQELLKATEPDTFDEELPPNPSAPYRQTYNDNSPFKPIRARRRPSQHDFKRPIKSKPGPIVSKPKRRFRSAIVINV